MWLCEGKDVTSDSQFQHPTPPQPSGKVDVNPARTRSVEWISEGTACALEGINIREEDAIDR